MILFRRRDPCIKLTRITETESGRTWIFTFVDPLHKFMQSIILAKTDNAGEKMEQLYEKLYCNWKERINESRTLQIP